VVVLLRLPAAIMPMIAITTTAPTMIQSHGTELVVVLVVVVDELGFVALVDDPVLALGPVIEFPPVVEPLLAGPVVVVVVLEPDVVPADCANVIAGATSRNSASNIRLSLKIGRMSFLPSNQLM
jgi:hypothetical protein